MKKHIKLVPILLFFLAAVNYSYGQTANNPDSSTQQNNAGTEINQQNNDGNTAGNNAVDTTTHTGQLNGMENGNFTIDKSGNMVPNSGTEQIETTVGKRKPNEYSSGRSGGQYNNPHPNDLPRSSSKTKEPGTGNSGTSGESSGNGSVGGH